jgi:hypothetical protein
MIFKDMDNKESNFTDAIEVNDDACPLLKVYFKDVNEMIRRSYRPGYCSIELIKDNIKADSKDTSKLIEHIKACGGYIGNDNYYHVKYNRISARIGIWEPVIWDTVSRVNRADMTFSNYSAFRVYDSDMFVIRWWTRINEDIIESSTKYSEGNNKHYRQWQKDYAINNFKNTITGPFKNLKYKLITFLSK